MAIVRNCSPSPRELSGISLPPSVDVEVPDDVLAAYKARGPGLAALFDGVRPILRQKNGTRTVRMESAARNAPPTDPKPKGKPKRKKAPKRSSDEG